MNDPSRVASVIIGQTKGDAVNALAKVICAIAGIAIVDDDGSANWWMFTEQARVVINDLDARGFGSWKTKRPPLPRPRPSPAEIINPDTLDKVLKADPELFEQTPGQEQKLEKLEKPETE